MSRAKESYKGAVVTWVGRDIQNPPQTNGTRNQVRVLTIWYVCRPVVRANNATNRIDAAIEGT